MYVKLKIFAISLLLPWLVLGGYPLSICAIFQNEAPYLKEWIEFHRLQGVEQFYLYNNQSTDDYLSVLKPYRKAGLVTLIDWPYSYVPGDGAAWRAIQMGAYDDCLNNHGADSHWIAFIDIDEFLFCPNGARLTHYLKRYTSYGAVGVNWLIFGTSHVKKIPPNRLLIETLTRCALENHPRNRRYKSIVQPQFTERARSSHAFFFKEGYYAVDTVGRKIDHHTDTLYPLVDRIRINHYWTRDESYFKEHKMKSRQDRYTQEDEIYQRRIASEYNVSEDRAILRFVPELKKKMGEIVSRILSDH